MDTSKAFLFQKVRDIKMSLAGCSFSKSPVIVFLLLSGAFSLLPEKNTSDSTELLASHF